MRHSLQLALGKAVRRLRAKEGFSQESFAAHCKIHRTYMGGIERGTRNVSLQNIERIARGLGLTAGELLTEAENER